MSSPSSLSSMSKTRGLFFNRLLFGFVMGSLFPFSSKNELWSNLLFSASFSSISYLYSTICAFAYANNNVIYSSMISFFLRLSMLNKSFITAEISCVGCVYIFKAHNGCQTVVVVEIQNLQKWSLGHKDQSVRRFQQLFSKVFVNASLVCDSPYL